MAEQLDRWGNPMPRQLKLKSGKVVTERYYDAAQHHQNCRRCGGDVYGLPIWYVRSAEAKVTPKHVTCPAEPTPYVEATREYVALPPRRQSVYAERRQVAAQVQQTSDPIQEQRERDLRDGVRHGGVRVGGLGYWLDDQFIEVE